MEGDYSFTLRAKLVSNLQLMHAYERIGHVLKINDQRKLSLRCKSTSCKLSVPGRLLYVVTDGNKFVYITYGQFSEFC